MEYLMFVCGIPSESGDPDPGPDMEAATIAWVEEMDGRGVRKLGNRLRPAHSATTLRYDDGKVLVSDGPFAETKEQILGFDLLECADLDEALEVSAKHPALKFGPIEVRPVWQS